MAKLIDILIANSAIVAVAEKMPWVKEALQREIEKETERIRAENDKIYAEMLGIDVELLPIYRRFPQLFDEPIWRSHGK